MRLQPRLRMQKYENMHVSGREDGVDYQDGVLAFIPNLWVKGPQVLCLCGGSL